MKSDMPLKNNKGSLVGIFWRRAPHWSYNGIGAVSWWGSSNNKLEIQFDKPTGKKSAGHWIRESSNWSPMLQINARYGLHGGIYEDLSCQSWDGIESWSWRNAESCFINTDKIVQGTPFIEII